METTRPAMAGEPAKARDPRLALLEKEMQAELRDILDWWKSYVLAPDGTSFYGSVDNDNQPDLSAVRGLVMHARILWAFSSGYAITHDQKHLAVAEVAYSYLTSHFHDKAFDGYFWSLDAAGNPHDTRKQVYGQAFCVYAFAAFYQQCARQEVLDRAIALFRLIESRSRENIYGGYIEAFNRDWSGATELRLSPKDQNDRKTMNTHLHIIEAYATLYLVWPDQILRESIQGLLRIFSKHFINRETGALLLFFTDEWETTSHLRSYGHDIEASWLLLQCAVIIQDELLEREFGELALLTAKAASEGLDSDGGLWYESDKTAGGLIREKHSWPQAEAMIGYFNAWQLSSDKDYLEKSLGAWGFIKKYLKDNSAGEWYWGVKDDYSLMDKEKAGFWKCPYHNTRASIELISRLGNGTDTNLQT